MTQVQQLEKINVAEACEGSYYTIIGCGGDLNQWVAGYNKELAEAGIGEPVAWYVGTGLDMNAYAEHRNGGEILLDDRFHPLLTFLFFPLTGLDVGKLAIFKLQWQDRWFDDVIDNMRLA